jgi:hypothetical protein
MSILRNRYAERGMNTNLALRTYTTRLFGSDLVSVPSAALRRSLRYREHILGAAGVCAKSSQKAARHEAVRDVLRLRKLPKHSIDT